MDLSYIFNHIGNILDAVGVFIFYDRMVGREKGYFSRFLTIIIMLAFNEIAYFISIPITSSSGFVIISVISFIAFSFTYRMKLYVRILLSIGYEVIAYASEIIVAQLIKLAVGDAIMVGEAFIIGMLVSKLVAMLLAYVTSFFSRSRMYIKEWTNVLGISICQIICIALMTVMTKFTVNSTNPYDPLIGIMAVLIVVLNVVFYFVIEKISSMEKLKSHQLVLTNDMKLQQANYRNIEAQYKNVKAYAHDVNKHLRTILMLINTNDIDSAKEYISSSLDGLRVYDYVNTGNVVVDVIVGDLIEKCRKNNIILDYNFNFNPADIDISNYDMTTILGNLVDNAVNAVNNISNADERLIDISICREGSNLIINIHNPYNPDKSTIHKGIGIENVEKTIKTLNGIYNISVADNIYDVTVSIPPQSLNKRD